MVKFLKVAFGTLLALIFVFVGAMTFFHPVVCKASDIHVELKNHFDPQENILMTFFAPSEGVKIINRVNVNTVGVYDLIYVLRHFEEKVRVHVVDTTPPELELKNIQADTVVELYPVNFIAKAKDASKMHFRLLEPVSKEPGIHQVKVAAQDAYGNETIKEAQVERIQDEEAPVFQEVPPLKFLIGSEAPNYMEGIRVQDNLDSNPKVSYDVSQVNLKVPGNYSIHYVAEDRSGNRRSLERVITVEEDEMAIYPKIVYLTFDDGPSANTGKILDILKKYDIKATFFVTGNNQKYAYNIQRAAAEGHTIGLHTYTHDYGIYRSSGTYFDDLNQVSQLVERLTGKKSHYLRFPGGSSNTVSRSYQRGIMSQLVQEVEAKGYRYYDWNCASADARGVTMPRDTIIQSAIGCQRPYVTILFHDSQPKTTTVEALPTIIEHYQKAGYVFRPISDSSFMPHHHLNN